MPRVIFDSQVFAEQSRGGVSRYFLNLAVALRADPTWRSRVVLGLHAQDEVPTKIEKMGPHMKLGAGGRGFRFRRYINRLAMVLIRPSDDGGTVYHPTWYHMPTIRAWRHLPITITIHDLIPEKWPAVTDARQLADRAEALRVAKSIVCVSETTRSELVQHFPWAASKATTALPGLPELPTGRSSQEFCEAYVVHVGKRGAYKDFATVLRAIGRLPSIRLVVVGGGPVNAREHALMAELDIEDRVVFESRVDDQRLANLFCDAVALVSASRAEGFGLPPIEAAAQGTPSVLTDIPVYREIHEPWAKFFPPADEAALAEAIDSVGRGGHPPLPGPAEIASMFPWERTVADMTAVYESALD